MNNVSDYFKPCLFRLELLKSLNKVPPILIGGSESKDEFIQLFYKNSHNIELSRAMEIDHLIGYSSIISTKEAEKLKQNAGDTVNNDWTKDIQSFTSNKNNAPSMIFHPGQIVLSIFRNEPVILQNLELLNENVIPRVDALLESYRNNKPYYIQESDKGYNVSLENCSFVALIDENAYSRTPLLDSFIYIHCDDCSFDEKKSIIGESSLGKEYEDRSLEFLKHAKSIQHLFKKSDNVNDSKIKEAIFLLDYLKSTSSERRTLKNKQYEDVDDILRQIIIKHENNLGFYFYYDPIKTILKNNKLIENLATSYILLSIMLASYSSYRKNEGNDFVYHYPLILEGAPGIGKSDLAIRYFNSLNIPWIRYNFSSNVEISQIFGSFTIKADKDGHESTVFIPSKLSLLINKNNYKINTNSFEISNESLKKEFLGKEGLPRQFRLFNNELTIGILLDELNLAPPELLDHISALIKASCATKKFHIPGNAEIDLVPHIIFIISQNPSTMSSNRGTLPLSLINSSIVYRDIQFTNSELATVSCNLLAQNTVIKTEIMDSTIIPLIKRCVIESQKAHVSFSLRDVLKAIMIFKNSKTDINSSLWLALLCKYHTDDRIKIEKELNIHTSDEINIKPIENGNGKKLQFISSTVVEIKTPGFESSLLSLTESEKMLMYQLALDYPSGRPILVYGQSPYRK